MQEHQLAEVHVNRHHHPAFRGRNVEECPVAWIGAEAVGEDHIMALVDEPVGKSPPRAGVDEESHPPATDTATSESPATTACA